MTVDLFSYRPVISIESSMSTIVLLSEFDGVLGLSNTGDIPQWDHPT